MLINNNFEKLPESYLFSTVAAKLREFKEANPSADVIRMDIERCDAADSRQRSGRHAPRRR